MIILGIDPGSKRIGYGAIKKSGSALKLIEAGLIKTPKNLTEIRLQINSLIKKFKPEILAVEKLYFAKNRKTGLEVAESRGVIVLSALENGLLLHEFTPNEIKAGVTGYGSADKKAVAKMVRLILGEPKLEVIDDVSDALAAAITASNKRFRV